MAMRLTGTELLSMTAWDLYSPCLDTRLSVSKGTLLGSSQCNLCRSSSSSPTKAGILWQRHLFWDSHFQSQPFRRFEGMLQMMIMMVYQIFLSRWKVLSPSVFIFLLQWYVDHMLVSDWRIKDATVFVKLFAPRQGVNDIWAGYTFVLGFLVVFRNNQAGFTWCWFVALAVFPVSLIGYWLLGL